MSATQLGSFFDRGAAAMNALLHKHGFLEGGPGAWRPTELGEQFAKWVDKDNGYGGSAYRAWSWLTWNDEVIAALKESIEANPNGILPTAPAVRAVVTSATSPANGSLGRGKWIALGVFGATAAACLVKRFRGEGGLGPVPPSTAPTQGPESHEDPEDAAGGTGVDTD
ncbi:hypothetical protein [Nocardioides daejeonensis]|uniref:hypothetical protein n=1 Tax=Nocardioides daejeonensis TaxID=1046556 RepID=UPI0013A5566F|nr:hypothetical protein [Nocardioides daejeonensis]